jgi:hypothetical protein
MLGGVLAIMATSSLPVTFSAPRNLGVERWSFVGFAIAMIAVSIAGFAPSLVQPAARRAPLSLLAGAHGLVFFAWQILFLAQSLLIATGRIAVHRRLGLAGVFLYFVMIPLGFATSIAMGHRGFDLSGDLKILPHASPGFVDPVVGLLFPLTDMAMFAVLAGAALCFVRWREIHKRLMLFANIMLMPAPLAHLIGHNPRLASLPAAIIMVPIGFFLAAAIARDYLVARRVHSLTWIVAILMFASGPFRVAVVGPSFAWQHFTAWLIR